MSLSIQFGPRRCPPPWRGIAASALSLIHTDAADEEDSVDLGGRRIIKKNKYREKNSDEVNEDNKNRTQPDTT